MGGYRSPQELQHARIRMDTNEVPYAAPITPIEPQDLNRYMSDSADNVRQALAAFHGVHEEQILFGKGSSQILDVAIAAFSEKGVVEMDPSYRQYRVLSENRNTAFFDAPTDENLRMDIKAFQAKSPTGSMRLVANPNNPTGYYESSDDLDKLANVGSGVLLVDEAYIDFVQGNVGDVPSIIANDPKSNVVVTRTFSKAYGAAGLRFGYGIGSKKNIALMKDRLPFAPTGDFEHQAAMQLLRMQDWMRSKVAEVIEQRLLLEFVLEEMGCDVIPSATNFILVKPNPVTAENVHSSLINSGIAVRLMKDQQRVADRLRVTVGTSSDNQEFLTAMRGILQQKKTPRV